jgi:outer membrane murein-binding lipoprotein Lpp
MKIRNFKHSLIAVVTVALIAGCASANYKQSAATASALTDSAHRIDQGNASINQALADLNDLVNNPQPDLRKQFGQFSSSVDDLGAKAKDVDETATNMKASGAAYFEKWDQELSQINNEDIRQRGESRKQDVAARFGRIATRYNGTRAAFQPFMSDLRDVQRFLKTDLTVGGLAASQTFAAKATRDAVPLRDAYAQLAAEFKGLGLSMSTAGPAKM